MKNTTHEKDKIMLEKVRNYKTIKEKMQEPIDCDFFANDSFRSFIDEDLFEFQSKLAYF